MDFFHNDRYFWMFLALSYQPPKDTDTYLKSNKDI